MTLPWFALPDSRQGECAMRGFGTLAMGFIIAMSVAATAARDQASSAQAFDGKRQFDIYCATCHGAEGKGDGALASSLRKRPADLTQLTKRNKGEFPTERIIEFIDGRTRDEAHRKSDMPVWGDVFSKTGDGSSPADVKARIEALVKHLETLQDRAKS
jgi:mono/diheme cytochrome c family protein